jgi:hypothetical protein
MSDLITFNKEEVMDYLDTAITRWRERKIESKEWEDILIASCYIDAFQSVRMSLFGEFLPEEENIKRR